jgi:hypothetical protein
MAVAVLIVIGIVIWMMLGNNSSEPKQKIQHSQNKADKEFEDIYFNGASGDDIDDF